MNKKTGTTNKTFLSKLITLALAWVTILSLETSAVAHEVNLSIGGFNLGSSLNSEQKSGSSTSLGAYQLEYRKDFFTNFNLGLGYSVNSLNIFSSYLTYGFDLTFYYFPFSAAQPNGGKSKHDIVSIESMESFRPFIGLSFNQRQISNSSINLIGGGAVLGTKVALQGPLELNLAIRYNTLTGIDRSLRLIDVLAGITLDF